MAHAIRDPREPHLSLYADEEAAITGMGIKRRMEFAAGRSAGHAVLESLGCPATSIPMGRDRAPIWPSDVVGSVSHSQDVCVAVAALSCNVRAIGIDVENLTSLDDDLAADIASPRELACMNAPVGLAALRVFSMKEAAYKAQYPISRTPLDFDALEVTPLGLRFRFPVPGFHRGALLPVCQWTNADLCLSLCVL
ncbi:4'-phosphopantetheinyl transferase superfamily protein [Halomonas organivorans]|uniref:Enterobactin synthase component D n=1 Tax=Halomonas organivorans TaxID=257772 RepID=A0A7W5BXA4_9GAMM|nr:4'-phosphopantetheinyl transferase EntD [Halomonas organivorans]